ncbi:glycosyltransferase family 4 protein [Ramlibacter sp. USB13]|uniref:Glycosyltransferase family 4 protein n=1 Tax=Ramlibacter cellulosilyticus TaxID=2764187 RepID=A0A923MMX0_9BURK|nr:glycosyltransferase family 4 protein [Ramlibacter cellulosilyticus]MBC5781623.1 glycosyltransferase family 4 protein [Ramlibacter cellulosilyticus]
MAGKRAPRVLMTADTVGGVWTHAVELARELDARGVRVALATMGAPVAAHQRAALAGCDGVTLFESTFRLEWMQEPWDDVNAAGEWLMALERDVRPDLVHLNQFAFGALPFRAPRLVVAHSCVASWWRAVHAGPAPAEWAPYRHRVQQGLAGATRVAAPTRAMLDALRAEYAWDGEGLVLPNGCVPEAFAPAPKQPRILAAGRFWDEAKNLRALEQAAPGLPWPVCVAGSAAHPDGGTVHPKGVQFLGELPREALARELAQAAIYALPARYEPFGLSVLEAALSGCALVLGDIASLREVWGPAARYVPPGDARALHESLQALIAAPEERARLAQAAQARAQRYTARAMADRYLACYAELAPRFAHGEELACA